MRRGHGLVYLTLLLSISTPTMAQEKDIPDWDVEGLESIAGKQGWTFDMGESWVTEHLRQGGSIEDITGLIPEDNKSTLNVYDNIAPRTDLPAQFDWNTEVPTGLQPIRNQGRCGSCWAFGATAILEALIKIKYPDENPDFAEQTLVSSCSNAGSCRGGNFTALNYMQSPGLPNEADDPYQARNTMCRRGVKPAGKIVTWAYIGDGRRTPTVEQMKTAIIEHGPIGVTVNASFGSYRNGIYNRCKRLGTNHIVTIEGWNDEGQYWIMRNSWGNTWGEKGYMRIRYTDAGGHKCNNIGRTAVYAKLADDFVPQ